MWTTVQVGSGKTQSQKPVILARHPARIVKIQRPHAQAVLSGSIYPVPHVNSVLYLTVMTVSLLMHARPMVVLINISKMHRIPVRSVVLIVLPVLLLTSARHVKQISF